MIMIEENPMSRNTSFSLSVPHAAIIAGSGYLAWCQVEVGRG